MAIVVPDIACLREPNLLIPGNKPIGNVKIDWDHPLARDLAHFWFPTFSSRSISHDLLGNEATFTFSTNVTSVESKFYDGDIVAYPEGTFSGTGEADVSFPSTVSSSKDLTVLTDCYISDLANDHSLVSCNERAWSWLDKDGSGNLRISAYTQYDTTNTISVAGRYKIGLIWRVDNTYQTIYQSRFSQSGTSTRQSFNGTCGIDGHGGIEAKTTDRVPGYLPYWWAVWARSLTEEECQSMTSDPYQFLIPA